MSKECAEKARKPEEIEVTPEMIEAGVDAYHGHSVTDQDRGNLREVVLEVYLAMAKRTPNPCRCA